MTLVLFGLVSVYAATAFDLPPQLVTTHLLGEDLPAGLPPVPLADEFYALGWSPTGDFAYLENQYETSDTRRLVFEIRDLVEDRPLELKSWIVPSRVPTHDWWDTHEAEIEALMSAKQIRPEVQQLGEFPLILGETYLQVSLLTHLNSSNTRWIDHINIVVHASSSGSKSVFNARGYWRWCTLLGFVPSPFENRVALIVLIQPTGWNGVREPLRYFIVGSSLTVGFSKP